MGTWKNSGEIYPLKNDVGMKNTGNLITPSGEVVSLFVVEGPASENLGTFDIMIKDYKNVTPNLKLVLHGKISFKDNFKANGYILTDKMAKKPIFQINFEHKNALYAAIFNIEKIYDSFRATVLNNHVCKEVITLLKQFK